ncbi:MAG TPA: hypothetical protein VGO11_02510 [Chthoniobacteraceae bacterium]|jgi:hypothetical protein|nr:hypothetical protein [Chthoniobacteraceae bacterium]
MPVVARISAIWSKQKLFVAVFFLLIGAYFFFDGTFTYPRSNQRWDAQSDFEKRGKQEEWPAFAAAKGWVTKKPEKRYETGDIVSQFVFGGVATVAGVLLLIYWMTQRKRLLKIDEGAVYTPSGARVPFASIRGLGKKRWDTKGIAIVRYEDNGRLLQFVVDDYKYETEPARQILDTIEQQLTAKNDHAA